MRFHGDLMGFHVDSGDFIVIQRILLILLGFEWG
jgi:hypothetical protein